MAQYAELQVTSNYSFLRGGAHGSELLEQAHALGLYGVGNTDRNSLAGVVRAHVAAKNLSQKLMVGCRLDPQDGPSLLCYPKSRDAYGRLCRLLTTGKRRAEKGDCHITLDDIYAQNEGQIFILIPPKDGHPLDHTQQFFEIASKLGPDVYLAASMLYQGQDRERLAQLSALAAQCRTPFVATNDVLYHVPERKALQDVLTCIREKCTIKQAGFRLQVNAERHLKSADEMLRLFKGYEEAVARTVDIAEQCQFSLEELRYEYPEEPVPEGRTPQEYLEELAWEGAAWRYPDGVPDKIERAIKYELNLVQNLDYAPYFLTVYDIVRFARSQEPEILCQGRGSAANSVVCYCLGITAVDPTQVDLLFERFVSAARNEPPDIDVDFEHERREEVIQYIYERYGREKSGITATVISYRSRSAIREVGKAMGLSEDVVGALAGTVWGLSEGGLPEAQIREAGLDPDDPWLARTVQLTHELIGFPRHLSQHVGGFVLTRGPLCEVVPIGNAAMEDRTFVEWDKDDLDALGILKVDVLGLGMLTCIRKCFELLKTHYGLSLSLATVPKEDPVVYDMICKADTLGVFQIESRAQMNMLPRLKPREYYDLVIEVAIVRPGPIQGDMVHPYLRRRDKKEPIIYPRPSPEHGPSDELEQVLSKTLGVPLFQEQAMRIVIEAAKFTPDEANQLRHAMATFRRRGNIDQLRDKMIKRMVERGYDPELVFRCYKQIEGFGEYGFPESHAASFALLVYISCWLKCHHPAVFACGLLNAQPMGFYAPAQIVRDAREHDVEVRAVDVNHSEWDNTLELREDGTWAVRLGMRQVDGMGQVQADIIVDERAYPYHDIHDLWQRSGVPGFYLGKLAAADAFRSMGFDRRQALWDVKAIKALKPLPLFEAAKTKDQAAEDFVPLPDMPLAEHVVADYEALRLSLKAHPTSFFAQEFARLNVSPNQKLWELEQEDLVTVAGVVLVRQRPGSAKGVVFMTLEDDTGIANIVIWPKLMEKYRKVVMGSRMVMVRGPVQREGDVIHVVARHLQDLTPWLTRLAEGGETFHDPIARADEVLRPGRDNRDPVLHRHPRNVRILPKSRDFH